MKECITHHRCDCTQELLDSQASEIERLKAEVETLKARKCSHGDYRMQGTTDCVNAYTAGGYCSGRTEYYVIGEGLCVECRHNKESK